MSRLEPGNCLKSGYSIFLFVVLRDFKVGFKRGFSFLLRVLRGLRVLVMMVMTELLKVLSASKF